MKKKNKILLWVIQYKFWSFIIVLLLFYLAYYSSGYYFVYNNDAYVFANVSRVSPPVSGKIHKVYVKDNQFVKKGQLLVELDQSPFINTVKYTEGMLLDYQYKLQQLKTIIAGQEAEINIIKAQLRLSNIEWGRFKKLSEDGAASIELYDIKRAKFDVMKAKLVKNEEALKNKQAERKVLKSLIKAYEGKLGVAKYNLEHSKIYADKDGYINHLRIYNGDYAASGKTLFGLVENDSWQIIANIKSDDLPIVSPGKRVLVYISSRPWHLYEGKVLSVGRAVARSNEPENAALPYVKPVLSWIRYPYRIPVRIILDDWPSDNDNNIPLYMGTDARVFILP